MQNDIPSHAPVMLHPNWMKLMSGIALVTIAPLPVGAQIVTDRTLPQSSIVTPDTSTPLGVPIFTIDGGTTAGTNLFHSFSEFSIPTGAEAFFNNAASIDNILTRVTGGDISSIDGLIRVNGSASLFLLNPNGIVFGENARLNIGGSFFATTAESLLFEGGVEFGTTNPNIFPLLSVSVPIGLQWNRASIAGITASGTTLEMGDRTLALIGGSVELERTTLSALSGRIELGGLAEPGAIEIENAMALNFPTNVARGSVMLQNGARVDVVGDGRGTIALHASDVTLSQGSQLLAGIDPGMGNLGQVGESIAIDATGTLALSDGSTIANDLAANTLEDGGAIEIAVDSLNVQGGSRIQTVAEAAGRSGDITVRTGGDINIAGSSENGQFSGILTRSTPTAMGNSGDIALDVAGSLNLSDGGFAGTATNGSGNGGQVRVNAGRLQFSGGGQILTVTTGAGRAGDITAIVSESATFTGVNSDFFANPLDLVEAFSIEAASFMTAPNPDVQDSGPDGVPYVSATRDPDGIRLGGTILGDATIGFDFYEFAVAEPDSRAIFDIDGGYLEDRLDPGNIDTQIFLFDRATGALIEESDDSDTTDGSLGSDRTLDSFILTTLEPGTYVLGVGAFSSSASADVVPIEGNSPILGDTYTLHISLENPGNPISPNPDLAPVTDAFNPNPRASSGILTQTEGLGDAGHIVLETIALEAIEGAAVATSTLAEGNAGSLTVRAAQINLAGESPDGRFRSGLFARVLPGASGNSGDLTVETARLLLDNRASISSSTFGAGNGGNLFVRAAESVMLESSIAGSSRSQIDSTVGSPSSTGNAGNLLVETDRLLLDGGSIISSTFGAGDGGDLVVRAGESVTLQGVANGLASVIFSQVRSSGATGNGGNLTVETGSLRLDDGADVSSATFGIGNAGNLTVETERLNLDGGSGINTATSGVGNAGNLFVRASEFVRLQGLGSNGIPSAIFSPS